MARQKARVEIWLSAKNGRWYGHKINTSGNVVAKVTGGDEGGYSFRQGIRRAAKRDFPGLPIEKIDDPNAKRRGRKA